MPSFTVNIPDTTREVPGEGTKTLVQVLLDAAALRYGYEETVTGPAPDFIVGPNPESRADFAKRMLARELNTHWVRWYLDRRAKEQQSSPDEVTVT